MSNTPGHRVLNEREVELITKIKEHERTTTMMLAHTRTYLRDLDAATADDAAEQSRIQAAEPHRWASIARTHFQEGYMALVRAIAQPTQ